MLDWHLAIDSEDIIFIKMENQISLEDVNDSIN
jgi:hypothetical protein